MRRHFKSVRICRGDLKSAFATFAAIDPFRRPKIKAVIRQYRVRSCEFGWHAASLQQGSTQDSLMLLPMRSLLKKIQSVYLTPWSLKTVIKRDEAEWFGQNATRRRLSLSRLERELLFAGEHPLRFAISLLTLQVALLVFVSLLPPDWFAPAWSFDWKAAEQISHFSTIWTIQATLAALV